MITAISSQGHGRTNPPTQPPRAPASSSNGPLTYDHLPRPPGQWQPPGLPAQCVHQVAWGSARIESVSRVIHVPYTLEQDEDGVWCASAQLRPGVGAVGDGATADEAIADLRDALTALIEEVGVPQELTLTLDVA